ncbi:MAG: hypothetical protein AAF497_00090, partial [Planctomycetota bacterium]
MLTTVPLSIDVSLAEQKIFSGAEEQFDVDTSTDQVLYQYAVTGPGDFVPLQFEIAPANGSRADAAFGFYDHSGNQISQFDGTTANASFEQANLTVASDEAHYVGVFFDQAVSPGDFQVNVSKPSPPNATLLATDVRTGMLQFIADRDGNELDRPSDVDFYSLDLTNGGTTGSLTITPQAVDGTIYAEVLFRMGSGQPWQEVARGSDATGQTVSLSFEAPTGKSLSFGEYRLAVSTADFAGAPGAYTIDIDASPVLVPESLTNPVIDPELESPSPFGSNQSRTSVDGTLQAGVPIVYQLKTTELGTVEMSVDSSDDVTLAIYDSDGSNLLHVLRNPDGQAVELLPKSDYLVRLASAQDSDFSLRVLMQLVPEPLFLAGNPTTQAFTVGQSRELRHFRVGRNLNDDVLVLKVDQS